MRLGRFFGGTLLMIVFLSHIVGVIELHETVDRLKDKYSFACPQRNDTRVSETLQLRYRQAHSADRWREAVCEAARCVDFAWIALRTTYDDGRVGEELRRPPNGKPDPSRIGTMAIPLKDGLAPGISQQLEVAICVNGSLEAAGRRATLFGRLIDEYTLTNVSYT